LLPKFGQSIVEVHQAIAAALLSPVLASGLKVKAGTTALEVQRTYKLANGGIAQVAINTHPASRFRHSMTMRRLKGGNTQPTRRAPRGWILEFGVRRVCSLAYV